MGNIVICEKLWRVFCPVKHLFYSEEDTTGWGPRLHILFYSQHFLCSSILCLQGYASVSKEPSQLYGNLWKMSLSSDPVCGWTSSICGKIGTGRRCLLQHLCPCYLSFGSFRTQVLNPILALYSRRKKIIE